MIALMESAEMSNSSLSTEAKLQGPWKNFGRKGVLSATTQSPAEHTIAQYAIRAFS
jgi:hypothetical protein